MICEFSCPVTSVGATVRLLPVPTKHCTRSCDLEARHPDTDRSRFRADSVLPVTKTVSSLITAGDVSATKAAVFARCMTSLAENRGDGEAVATGVTDPIEVAVTVVEVVDDTVERTLEAVGLGYTGVTDIDADPAGVIDLDCVPVPVNVVVTEALLLKSCCRGGDEVVDGVHDGVAVVDDVALTLGLGVALGVCHCTTPAEAGDSSSPIAFMLP
jgi:hypothetical protein